MDDNFNTNNTPLTPPVKPVNDNATVPPVAPAEQPAAAEQKPFSQPTQQYYTAPYGSAPTQPYNSQPTPSTINSPAPSVPGASFTPPAPPTPPKAGKKKPQVGKIVFIALICISIVFSSIAIGVTFSDKTETENTVESVTDTKEETTGSGAIAKTEDSPVSYEKYSGKGTMTAEQVYAEVKDINVGILVYAQGQSAGEGSGIIIGEDSTKTYTYIMTAAHVISESGVEIQVQFTDDTDIEATIVGIDTKTDIGVLKVKKTGLPAATFGNSNKLTVGQTVYAIGNPGGTEFFGSFTSGMISAIDRPVPTSNSSYDLPCIQHNAAINPGNSGGALVNEYGQVIGLNSSKISSTEYEGMGFAVPSETMIEVYDELVKHGYVSNRPMLGITYSPVSSNYNYAAIAWQNDLPYGTVVIASISETSDLTNHDVQVGDMITGVNGKEMDTTDVLLEAIENADVGETLKLDIVRIGRSGSVTNTFTVTIKLVEDKGDNTIPEETEPTVDPYSFFEEFYGYGY